MSTDQHFSWNHPIFILHAYAKGCKILVSVKSFCERGPLCFTFHTTVLLDVASGLFRQTRTIYRAAGRRQDKLLCIMDNPDHPLHPTGPAAEQLLQHSGLASLSQRQIPEIFPAQSNKSLIWLISVQQRAICLPIHLPQVPSPSTLYFFSWSYLFVVIISCHVQCLLFCCCCPCSRCSADVSLDCSRHKSAESRSIWFKSRLSLCILSTCKSV